MSNQEGESPESNKPKSSGFAALWLIVAFVPSLVALLTLDPNSSTPAQGLLVFTAICCLCSGLGVVRTIKSMLARVFVGLFLAGVFFVLNVIVVVLIGCSRMRF